MSRPTAAVAAIALLASSATLADTNRGLEFGVGVTTNKYEIDGLGGSRRASGADAFVGYRFSRFVAAEASYLYGGSISDDIGPVRVRVRMQAYGVSILPTFPIGESFAVFGRAGFFHAEGKLTASVPGFSDGFTDSDDSILYGAGIRATLDGAHLRLEYNRASFGDIDSDRVALSVAWLF